MAPVPSYTKSIGLSEYLARLQEKEPWALTTSEWLLLAVKNLLPERAIQWRMQLAMIEDCLDQGVTPDGESLDIETGPALRSAYAAMFHGYPVPILRRARKPDYDKICEAGLDKASHGATRYIHRFVPGDHFHVLDTKFDKLEDAIEHLTKQGYTYGGLEYKHVYAVLGD